MRFVFFALSISSSWGNGHATTYRGLVRELHRRGHRVTFYEKRTEWYDSNCDLPWANYCDIRRYKGWPPPGAQEALDEADVVVVGSYAVDGEALADWLPGRTRALLAYYDIDTPVTLERFEQSGRAEYLRVDQLSHFDVALSFAGGPALDALRRFGARRAEPLYCAVDGDHYRPVAPEDRFRAALGYMGTYALERQDMVDKLFLEPARLRPAKRFALAGAQYPDLDWPPNVDRLGNLAPPDHPAFFAGCDWQVKVLRQQMRRTGWAPSVTLFEAAACAAPLISDRWPGFEDFLEPGREAIVADTPEEVAAALDLPESQRRAIGEAGRRRLLASHTYVQRVDALEALLAELGVPAAGRAAEHAGWGQHAGNGRRAPEVTAA
jgi:spore maturation protein CgeB